MGIRQSVGLEAIATQDDTFVNEALLLIDRIRDRRGFYNIAGKEVYNNATLLEPIRELEKLMTKRFKVTIQFLYHGVDVMGYFKLLPNVVNGLDEGYEKVVENLKKDSSDTVKYKEDEFRRGSKSLMSFLSKQQVKLIAHSKKNKIMVNRKDATISGVPKDIIHFIAMDWEGNRFGKSTPREYLAVLVHEMGHVFTYHEYSHKHVKNTIVTIEAFKKIKNPKEFEKAITVVSEELKIDLSGSDKNETVVRMAKGMVSTNDDNVHYYKDAEMLADQFASRFGLSDALSSALTKFIREQSILSDRLEMFWRIRLMVMALMLGVLAGGPSVALLYIGVSVGVTAIFAILFGVLAYAIFSSDGTKMPYDSMLDRVKRIKQDVLRQMRELEGGPLEDKILVMIEQLDSIGKDLQYLTEKREFAPILADMLFHRGTSSYSKMEKDLEALEANPLVAMKHKLKQLKER